MSKIRERLSSSDSEEIVREIVNNWPDAAQQIELADAAGEFFAGLAMKMSDLAEAAEESSDRADFLTAYGDVLSEKLGLEESAVEAYRSAFQANRAHRRSLERARQIYRERGNYERVMLLYQLQQRGLEEVEERNRVQLKMAHLAAEFLDDPDKALELLEDISGDSRFAETANEMKNIYAEGKHLGEAVEQAVENGEELEKRDEIDRAKKAFDRAARFERVREKGSLEKANDYQQRATDVADSRMETQPTTKSGEDEDKSAESKETEPPADDSEQRDVQPTRQMSAVDVDIGAESDDELTELRLSGWKQRPLQNYETDEFETAKEAMDFLQSEPANIDALATAAQQMVDDGHYRQLADRLEKSLRYLRGEEGEKDVTIELGHIFWKHLGELQRAEEFFNRLKLLDRTHPAMVAFYEAYYRDDEQWRKLFTFLSSQQRRADDVDDAVEIAARLSDIAENRMNSSERAIGVWKDVLREYPDNDEASQQLERLYRDHEKWHALADYLEGEFERLQDESEFDEQLELLERLVPIYRDKLDHNSKLIKTLGRILELDPAHQTAFNQLRSHLSDREKYSELAELLSKRAQTQQGEAEIELRLEVANIWQHQLQNPSKAIPQLSRILEVEPRKQQVRTRLENLLSDRRDYDQLFDLKKDELELLEGEAKVEALEELVEFAETKLNDDDRLIEVLEILRQQQPDRIDVHERLADQYRRKRAWGPFVEILESEIPLYESETEQLDRLTELGKVLEDKQGDVDKASDIYEDILARDPDNAEALERLTQIWLEKQKLDELADLYRQRGELKSLAEILESTAALAEDPDVASQYYAYLADLFEEELDAPRKAVSSLESLLEMADDKTATAMRLRDKYRELGDVEGELEMNRLLLDRLEEVDDGAAILDRLVELALENDEAHRVLEWLLQAAGSYPNEPGYYQRAEDLAKESDLRDLFVEKSEALLATQDKTPLQEAIWESLAAILSDRGEFQGAIHYYENLVERYPEKLALWKELRYLYREVGDEQNLRDAIETQIELETEQNGRDRSSMLSDLVQLGQLYEKNRDFGRAEKLYREVLDSDSENLEAIRGLARINEEQGEYDEAVGYLEQQLQLTDDLAHRTRLQRQLGEIYHNQLEKPARTLHYFDELLEDQTDPDDTVIKILEELLGETDYAREASLLLEPIYRQRSDSRGLADALRARLETSEDDSEKRALLEELFELHRNELQNTERAFELAQRWFQIAPEDDQIWNLIEEVGDELDKWREIEELFSDGIVGEKLSDRDLELLRRVAEIRETELDAPQEALEAWQRLYRERPENLDVVNALERLFREVDNHSELLDILKAKGRIIEDESQAVRIWEEIGELSEQKLDETEPAISAYRKILQVDPNHTEALRGLERVLSQRDDYETLVGFYRERAELVEEQSLSREFRRERAKLLLDEFEDYVGAADELIDLVEIDPEDREAIDILELLEQQLRDEGADDDLLNEVIGGLEGVYRYHEEYDKLVELLERKSELLEDDAERVVCLDELANLHSDTFEDPERAFDVLTTRIRTQPDSKEARQNYEDIALQLGKERDVIETYTEAEQASSDEASLYKAIARIHRDELDEPKKAIDAFRRAGEFRPGDPDILSGLEALYRDYGDYQQLVDILEKQLETEAATNEVGILRQIGDIYAEHLDDPESAIERYSELLDLAPDDLEALQVLEQLYGETGQFEELADVLDRQIEVLEDSDGRVAKLTDLGDVCREHLDDRNRAIDAYQSVLDIDCEHPEALEALEELLQSKQNWEELAGILRFQLEASEFDADQKAATSLKLGELLYRHLEAPDEALDIFSELLEACSNTDEVVENIETLLQHDPVAGRAADLLEPIYRDEGAWTKMVTLFETRISLASSATERASYLAEIGHIQRQQLGNPDEALEVFAEALKLDPENESTHEDLADIVDEAGDWRLLKDTYQQILDEPGNEAVELEYEKRMADLARDQLEDMVEAETHYRNAISIDQSFRPAYEALQEMTVEQERWLDLVELIERRLERDVFEGEDEKERLLTRMAEIQEQRLNDPFSAADTYRQLVDVEPGNEEAADRLERLYREQERWEELIGHLEERISFVGDPEEAVALKTDLADVLADKMYRLDEACDVYRDILEIEPHYQPVIDSLEEIFENNPDFRTQAGRLLEPIYRDRQDWAFLIDVLCTVASSKDKSKQAYLDQLHEAASLASDELEDHARAFQIYGDLFESEPHDRDIRLNLRELATETGQWEDLVGYYDTAINENFDLSTENRLELLFEKGRILEERLGKIEKATQVFDEILLEEPEHEAAIDRMERLLSRNEAWAELAEFYRDQATRVDNETRPYWLEREATIYDDVLNDIERSIESYFRLKDLEPGHREATEALIRLLGHRERWHDLAQLYRDQLDSTLEPDEQVEYRLELAKLQEDKLDLVQEAVQNYRQILVDRPGDERVIYALEGLRRDLESRGQRWNSVHLDIIDLLLSHYNTEANWPFVIDLLEEKMQIVEQPRERLEILQKLSSIVEEYAEADHFHLRGLKYLAEAVSLDPLNSDIIEELYGKVESPPNWEQLIPTLLEGVEQTDDLESQRTLLKFVADVYAGELDDYESAIALYQQLIEIGSGDEALERLKELYGELQMWNPLVSLLEERLDNEFDKGTRSSLLRQIGDLAQNKLGDTRRAISTFEELRQIEPGATEVLSRLERLYAEAERFDDLTDVLREGADVVDEPDGKIDKLNSLATVYREYLDESEKAIEIYREILQIRDDESTRKEVSKLLAETGRWADLLDNLEHRIDEISDDEQSLTLKLQRAEILLEKLNSPAKALAEVKEVVATDPLHSRALDVLTSLLDYPDTRVPASNILEDSLREAGEWSRLKDVWQIELSETTDPERAEALYLKLLDLLQNQFDELEEAFELGCQGIRRFPERQKLWKRALRLGLELESVQRLVELLEELIEQHSDRPELEKELRSRLGWLYRDVLQTPRRAIEQFENARGISEDPETLLILDELYQKQEDWDALIGILERRYHTPGAGSTTEIAFRLGYLKELVDQDYSSALDLYGEVLDKKPGHEGVIEGLERIVEDPECRIPAAELLEEHYRQNDQYGRLSGLLNLKIEAIRDEKKLIEHHRRAADLEVQKLGNPAEAFEHLKEAFRLDPYDADVQQKFEKIGDEEGFSEQIVQLYEEVVADLGDPKKMVSLSLEAGVRAKRLGQMGRGLDLFRRVIDLEPENSQALDAIEEIARAEGDLDSLTEVLEHRADLTFDDQKRRETLLELSEAYEELNRRDDAIRTLRQILVLDENDTRVLRKLKELYRLENRTPEYLENLERLIRAVDDNDEKIDLHAELARESWERLNDIERAITHYSEVLRLEPHHAEATQSLEELYRETGEWDQLYALLDKQLGATEDSGQLAEINRRKADIAFEELGNTEEALNLYERALTLSPGNTEVIQSLRKIYGQFEAWKDLVELLETQLDEGDLSDPDVERRLRLELAQTYFEHGDEMEQAIEQLHLILKDEPEDAEALSLLANILEEREDYEELAQIFEKLVGISESPEQKLEYKHRRAELFASPLDEFDAATELLEDILAEDPNKDASRDLLKDLLRKQGEYEQLIEMLWNDLDSLEPEQKVDSQLEIAELAREHLGEDEIELTALEHAFDIERSREQIVDRLLEIYGEQGEFEKAKKVLTEAVEAFENARKSQRVTEYKHRLGELMEQMDQLDKALETYKEVHSNDSKYVPNLLSLGRLSFELGEYDYALNMYQTLLLHQSSIEDSEDRVQMYYYLGRLRQFYEEPTRARDMFNRALDIDPDHEATLEAKEELAAES